MLAHGDAIRLGQAGDTDIVFFVGDEAPSVEKSAVSAASELRQMAALLEGLRALGSGRVLDEVLALVLDSAIEVTGAERGFIMLANRDGGSSNSSWRARAARSRCRAGPSRPAARFPRRCSPPASRRSSRICSTAISRSCTPARSRSASATCCARRCGWCATSRRAEQKAPDEMIGVLYLDSRERGALRSAPRAAALETLSRRSGAGDRERAALPRGARQGEVRAGAESRGGDSAVAAAGRRAATARSSRPPAASLPCRAVGGDFFDYVDLPGGQFGFIVGDVAGKGSPAALLAAAVLGMFSAEATYQNERGSRASTGSIAGCSAAPSKRGS